MPRNRPLIGISAYEVPADFSHWREVPSVLVPAGYPASIVRAGGWPVLLPPTDLDPAEVLDAVDGLVLVGGADINPSLYGQQPHPEALAFSDIRDRAEMALLEGALERDMPVLGICRGMQLLNIAAGGDLHQHIAELIPDLETHRAAPGNWARHEVDIVPGCRLGELLGERASVVSAHHQAPVEIGRDLVVTATAGDGTVEAVEHSGKRFAVGVLWHPEEDAEGGAPLFAALVEEARQYRGVTA
ncbi:MAG: gamma-glutamyl-gamma-aminobutyrate hydrolase family protein [Gaiellales bacterium]